MQHTEYRIQNANHKPQTAKCKPQNAKYILTMLQAQAEHEER